MDWHRITRILSVVVVIEALAIPVVVFPLEAVIAYGCVGLVVLLTHVAVDAWEGQ